MALAQLGLDIAATALLNVLRPFLPAPVAGLPDPRLDFVELRERSVGIGNRRGSEAHGALGLTELKGIRLDAVVRFEVGGADAAGAEAAAADLGIRLLGARDALWSSGIQRLALRASPVAIGLGTAGFRKTVDYAALYEFRYADTDGAQSLIALIPIHTEREEIGGPGAESTTVTDELVRWDNQSAPGLVVRGPVAIGGLALLRFVPGTPPTGAVTVTRTFDGASGVPAGFTALLPFLVAVAGPVPPVRHARLTLPSLGAFINEFTTAGPPVGLGDWDADGVTDLYTPATLPIEPAIELRGAGDRLEVAYADAALDQVGVLYLRAERGAVG